MGGKSYPPMADIVGFALAVDLCSFSVLCGAGQKWRLTRESGSDPVTDETYSGWPVSSQAKSWNSSPTCVAASRAKVPRSVQYCLRRKSDTGRKSPPARVRHALLKRQRLSRRNESVSRLPCGNTARQAHGAVARSSCLVPVEVRAVSKARRHPKGVSAEGVTRPFLDRSGLCHV